MDGRRPWPSELPVVQPTCAALDDAVPTPPTPDGVPPPWPAHPSGPESPRWPLRQRRRHDRHYRHRLRQIEPLPPSRHDAHGYAATFASAPVPASQQPMESLVDKLTLETQDGDFSVDWKASAPLAQHRMTGLVREQAGMPMDIDADEGGSAETATASARSLEMMRMRPKFPRRNPSHATCPSDAAASLALLVQPPTTAAIPGPAITKSPLALEPSLPIVALEPVVDMRLFEIEADEGYCEGNDDMSWLADAANMNGMPRTVRSNSVLKFRTSTEAALQCSLVVRKNPRMRRRRQKKLETRLKATDASIGGPDGPRTHDGRLP